MGSALQLRTDFVGDDLRKAARLSKHVSQTRRLLTLAEIYDGGSRGHAARVGGVTVQIVRDSVMRFNAQGPEGLLNVKAPGKRPKLDDDQRQELRRLVEKGPIPAIHGVVRWRLKDLARWIFQEHRISLDESTVGRELKAMGFAKLSARPRHYAQNELAVEDFKRASRKRLKPSAKTSLAA
jgi:transposase